MSKISIVTPVHNMENRDSFMKRLEDSLAKQTFQDFELVVTEDGLMAENTNSAIKKAKGEIIKILYMDDYLYSPYALEHIVNEFKGGWMATGCVHDNGEEIGNPHLAVWNKDVASGANTIGSPSVIAFENNNPLLFDEKLSWLLDCELYGRLFDRYGEPQILNHLDVAIGLHQGQTTHLMSDEDKQKEHEYLHEKTN